MASQDGQLSRQSWDKSRLLTAQIWIQHLACDFDAMNEVWNHWTAPNSAPTRATAPAEMGAPDVLVEIIMTAALAN
ncbi:Rid family hydrolase [Mesorhizobium sp.]|uniref:Rid family hydrolase n=1 Tax=Mesorhizobium sp. TaxID=1871066 RepID=UPI00345871BA